MCIKQRTLSPLESALTEKPGMGVIMVNQISDEGCLLDAPSGFARGPEPLAFGRGISLPSGAGCVSRATTGREGPLSSFFTSLRHCFLASASPANLPIVG